MIRAAIIVCVNVRADALKKINSAEKRGNRQVPIRLCSKVMDGLLTVMMKDGHFGEFDKKELLVVLEVPPLGLGY